jgi:transketolase
VENQTFDLPVVSGARLRKRILEHSFRSGAGEFGSALSIADIVSAVVTTFPTCLSEGRDRDRFVLSKGNASLAWYAALESVGTLTKDQMNNYYGDGSSLGLYPQPQTKGIDFGTGASGMGLSFAVGTALASRFLNENSHTCVIMSDAECNEGSVWEAASFAAKQQLDHLVLIVDNNQHNVGGQLADRWRSFGWAVEACDGHKSSVVSAHLQTVVRGRPKVIIARTVYGFGVSALEHKPARRMPLNRESFEIAMTEIASRSDAFDESAR